jgi:hypothetical protein
MLNNNKAIPGYCGMFLKNNSIASSPPAEAPYANYGKITSLVLG